MNFSRKVVHAFFYHDSEEDIIKGIFSLIEGFKSRRPGKASYIETRVKKYCDEHAGSQSYEALVLKAMEDITEETWKWNDVARVFWVLNLIDDAASHRVGPSAREMFRERMIKKVGDKLSFIDKYQWITMPLLNAEEIPQPENTFGWPTFVAGGVLALFLWKIVI